MKQSAKEMECEGPKLLRGVSARLGNEHTRLNAHKNHTMRRDERNGKRGP